MRVALLTDESLPNGTRIHAKMIHELASEFQEKGHKSVVITPGHLNQKSKLIIDEYEGVEIWRFKSGQTRGVSMLKRVTNEWLFSIRAWQAISEKVSNDSFDLCINYSPTIFFGPLARKLKQNGAFVYLVLRDMFPQWIIDQGIIRENSIASAFLKRYEKLNYEVSDCIGVMSKANLELFCRKYPHYTNVKILMNWSSTHPLKNQKKSLFREKHNLLDKIIFFYGGNLGKSNDMKNIMKLAKNLKDHNKAHFLIIGQGDELNLIKDLKESWNLKNVTILPSVEQNKFKRILTEIDVGLFTLSKKHTSHNFPGKLLGYMVESKPILGSVNPENDLMELINDSKSGYVFVNGEDDLLVKGATRLLNNSFEREEMGKNANSLLLNKFSVESAQKHIINEFNKNGK